MKYYSDITNQLYETREQLFKAERDYRMKLIAKARAYVNLNGKEFYSEGADSWNDVKKAVREYLEKLQELK